MHGLLFFLQQKPTEDVLGENENVKLKLGDVTKLKKCLFLYAETSVNFHDPPPHTPPPPSPLSRSDAPAFQGRGANIE